MYDSIASHLEAIKKDLSSMQTVITDFYPCTVHGM